MLAINIFRFFLFCLIKRKYARNKSNKSGIALNFVPIATALPIEARIRFIIVGFFPNLKSKNNETIIQNSNPISYLKYVDNKRKTGENKKKKTGKKGFIFK